MDSTQNALGRAKNNSADANSVSKYNWQQFKELRQEQAPRFNILHPSLISIVRLEILHKYGYRMNLRKSKLRQTP